MNPEVKQKWIDALRSGEYKQGYGQLCQPNTVRFCCLGVLCELAIKDGLDVEKRKGETKTFYDGDIAILPRKVMDWAGLENLDPLVNGVRVSRLNDAGSTFPELANLIEKEL